MPKPYMVFKPFAPGLPAVMVVKDMFLRGWDLLHSLSGDGNWTLNSIESLVMNAAVRSLPEHIQSLIGAQLQHGYILDRTSNGRVCVFRFFSLDRRLKIDDQRFTDMTVVVTLEVDGKEQNAHIRFREGYAFCLEFSNATNFYRGRSICVNHVSARRSSQVLGSSD